MPHRVKRSIRSINITRFRRDLAIKLLSLVVTYNGIIGGSIFMKTKLILLNYVIILSFITITKIFEMLDVKKIGL